MARIRRRWPRTRILLRGDSGFAREALMAWCEANRVDFLFGLARNERLEQAINAELMLASLDSTSSGRPARRFKDFMWSTLDSRSLAERSFPVSALPAAPLEATVRRSSVRPENVGSRFLSLLQSARLQIFSAVFGTAKKPNYRKHSQIRLGVWRAERSGKLLSEGRFVSGA